MNEKNAACSKDLISYRGRKIAGKVVNKMIKVNDKCANFSLKLFFFFVWYFQTTLFLRTLLKVQ